MKKQNQEWNRESNGGQNRAGRGLMDRTEEKLGLMQCKVRGFLEDESGMGVVEVILITVVLIALVLIFKKQITVLVNGILGKMTKQANLV